MDKVLEEIPGEHHLRHVDNSNDKSQPVIDPGGHSRGLATLKRGLGRLALQDRRDLCRNWLLLRDRVPLFINCLLLSTLGWSDGHFCGPDWTKLVAVLTHQFAALTPCSCRRQAAHVGQRRLIARH